MDDIQITTTNATAESCGYVLMGCRNSLSARCSSDDIDPMLKQMLNEQKEIISKIITAFAQADIVSEPPKLEAQRQGFQAIRYIRPNADRRGEFVISDAATAVLAGKVIKAGGTFTIEKINETEQSLCCEAEVTVDGCSEVEDIVCVITNEIKTIEKTWSSVVTAAAIELGVVA